MQKKRAAMEIPQQPDILERTMGVEPTHSAWEANVLPINYVRITVGIISYLFIFFKCLYKIQ